MYLNYKPSKYKDKTYKFYEIAESYRKGKKVKKRTIFPIGKLTQKQAEQIRLILKLYKDPDEIVTTLSNVMAEETQKYLDVAIVNQLWEQWGLSKAFVNKVTRGDLSTSLIAKILTINRCLDPLAHYSVPEWIKSTALSDILRVSLEGINDDKIYYELSKIEKNKYHLEDFLFRKTYQYDPSSYDYVNYDLTTSYFVGFKCKLSAFGRSKDDRPHNKQVVLAVMINSQGYPFKWDVYPGNTAEIHTLAENMEACALRFKLKGITMVFDRGLVSEDNLDLVEEYGLKYITTLDKDQIPQVPGVDLKPFMSLSENRVNDEIQSLPGFRKFDEKLYFQDLGVQGQRRYILGINPTLFLEERRGRREKIALFRGFVRQKNEGLKRAKRSRDPEATRSIFTKELKRLKIQKYFEAPQLNPIKMRVANKNGVERIVNTYQVTINKRNAKIRESKLLDGLCVFVTNHVEPYADPSKWKIPPERIIDSYRKKTQIEDVFKHIKSFLKIRPFFVNTDEHVRAVYTICILAYFLNKFFAERRRNVEQKDYFNSHNLYRPFERCQIVTMKDKLSGAIKKDTIPLTGQQEKILNGSGLSGLIKTVTKTSRNHCSP
jgi:transposase